MGKAYLLIAIASVMVGCATTPPTGTSRAQSGGGDGLSCQGRVKVPNVPAEYAWIKTHYPGSKVKMQSLSDCDGSPTDELHIATADGRELDVFFDISSFFGKGF